MGQARIYSKIDRAVVNSEWIHIFPLSCAIFLKSGVSYHSPCIVKMGEEQWEGPRPFRFCEMWKTDPRFKELIEIAWEGNINGHPMFVLVNKLKKVKNVLNQLHRGRYTDLKGRITELEKNLQQIQENLQLDPFNDDLINEEKQIRSDYQRVLAADLSIAAQRSKIDWLSEVDCNTTYFHDKVKERLHRGRILSISDSEGNLLQDQHLIQQEFINFYVDLFGTENQTAPLDNSIISKGRILTEDESLSMCRPFTSLDVKQAVFSIPDMKAPGPDGFTAGFFKAE